MFGKKGNNQFIKTKKSGIILKTSIETKIKISNSNKGKKHTNEFKEKLSIKMKEVVRKNISSYNSSNINGRSKKVWYKNEILDSSWEYLFAKWCDDNNIKWIKPKKGFEYEWNGKRIYYPDFYLEKYNVYIEIKGYERERDLAKWKVVKNLFIIKRDNIKRIENNEFDLEILLKLK